MSRQSEGVEIAGINPVEIMLMLAQYLSQNDLKRLTVQDDRGRVIELTIKANRFEI